MFNTHGLLVSMAIRIGAWNTEFDARLPTTAEMATNAKLDTANIIDILPNNNTIMLA